MISIPTEVTVILNGENKVFSPQRIRIKVVDEAAGPFLVIEGEDDEPKEYANEHCFYLQSEKEIDEFAAICKKVLMEAEHG